jgi:hypothetical protein
MLELLQLPTVEGYALIVRFCCTATHLQRCNQLLLYLPQVDQLQLVRSNRCCRNH